MLDDLIAAHLTAADVGLIAAEVHAILHGRGRGRTRRARSLTVSILVLQTLCGCFKVGQPIAPFTPRDKFAHFGGPILAAQIIEGEAHDETQIAHFVEVE